MIKILITGANSYIGQNVENWLIRTSKDYIIDTIDTFGETWKAKSFKDYDVIFHVAGIAHVSSKKNQEDLYYKVNRDLAINIAKKAKAEGVSQFIFMSSIIVYGNVIGKEGIINLETSPNPINFYGNSKLQAEEGINLLNDASFKVAVLRPPMIYGKSSKGNYPRLSKLSLNLPIFPNFPNFRSMLYIENLCEFVKNIIDLQECGLYFPQNEEYVCTSTLVKEIANVHNKKIRLVKIFNPIISLFIKNGIIKKIFGSKVYDKSISKYDFDYQIADFKKSILITEDAIVVIKE